MIRELVQAEYPSSHALFDRFTRNEVFQFQGGHPVLDPHLSESPGSDSRSVPGVIAAGPRTYGLRIPTRCSHVSAQYI